MSGGVLERSYLSAFKGLCQVKILVCRINDKFWIAISHEVALRRVLADQPFEPDSVIGSADDE